MDAVELIECSGVEWAEVGRGQEGFSKNAVKLVNTIVNKYMNCKIKERNIMLV